MSYLICLPTYNEAENIAFMLDDLKIHGYNDVIVSDGQSTDGTLEIALQKNATLLPRSGHGKGYAIKDALAYATKNNYQGLIVLDCDRTYPVSEIPKLINKFPDADMVVGCRNFGDIDVMRRLANYIMTGWTNLIFSARVKDMASGMRMIRVDKFYGKITAKSFDIEPQLHSLALKNKWRIEDVNITYRKRTGSSKINIIHLFLILYRVLHERFKP